MPLSIVRNDLVKMNVDVIVNSANPKPIIGAGVDERIHTCAGEQLLQARLAIGDIACGEAKITDAYNLHAKYVIHTIGPIHTYNHVYELLSNCYRNSLLLAKEYKCKSIAFPLISTGTYGVDKAKALQIAIQTIHEFLLDNDMMVYLVVYDHQSYQLSEHLYNDVQSYIDENYVEETYNRHSRNIECEATINKINNGIKVIKNFLRDIIVEEELEEYIDEEVNEYKCNEILSPCIEDLIEEVDDTFAECLFKIIDNKGLKDPDVYKKANIDRRLFSKIRSNKHYQPSKSTALALAFALELNLDETKDMLNKAGYALSNSNKVDIIFKYFIEQNNYNIYELNEVLFKFTETTLGG